MPPEPHHWMSYLGGLVSPFIAAMALWVAARQSKTNMAKLRLDLYDKRFAIYEATLSFYQALGGLPGSLLVEPFLTVQRQFIKAHRESQFLFDDEAGVFELLGRINLGSIKVIAAKTRAHEMGGDRAGKLVAEANDVYLGIEKSINELEQAIGPYVRFNKALI
jgi:hypothetical protein